MEMTKERWDYLCDYSKDVFGEQNRHLAGLMDEAVEAGLPDIAVSADVGRLLMILTSLTPGRLALEIGTLGGYSGIWIARGLAGGGRLITIESEPQHAAFAQRQFERAGVAEKVEIRQGQALNVLPVLLAELEDESVNVVFIDAEKEEYVEYWQLVRPLIAPGGLVLADNIYGSGWAIDQEDDPRRKVVDAFNRTVAGDPGFETTAVPLRSGVLIGRRTP